jgi:hypothetical protein
MCALTVSRKESDMTNDKQNRNPVKAPRTRYVLFTRYEGDTGSDPESNEAAGTRNFPSTFIPMVELEESSAAE